MRRTSQRRLRQRSLRPVAVALLASTAIVTPVGAALAGPSARAPLAQAADGPGLSKITVTDLKTNKAVSLRSLTSTKVPTLYWMWAPT
jgi:hypothetical protein